jgi:hypothetical protein
MGVEIRKPTVESSGRITKKLDNRISCKYILQIAGETESKNKHIINYCDSRLTRKVNNQHRSDLVYTQNDNLEPKKILIVINGYVSETKDFSAPSKNNELFNTQNTFNDLHVKMLDDTTSSQNFSKHKVLLIRDSHLRGHSKNIKFYLNDQFQVK